MCVCGRAGSSDYSASAAALTHGYLTYVQVVEFRERYHPTRKMKRSESDVRCKSLCYESAKLCDSPMSLRCLNAVSPPAKELHSQIIPLCFLHKCHQSASDSSACPANQTAGPPSPTSPTSAGRHTMKSSRYVIPLRQKPSNQSPPTTFRPQQKPMPPPANSPPTPPST